MDTTPKWMYPCSNQIFFFQYLKNHVGTTKEHGFLSYTSTIYLQKLAADDNAYLRWDWFLFFDTLNLNRHSFKLKAIGKRQRQYKSWILKVRMVIVYGPRVIPFYNCRFEKRENFQKNVFPLSPLFVNKYLQITNLKATN